VEFERPCGYFLSLVAFATYLPVREDFYQSQGGRYAADAEDLLFNGPFQLTSWVHGASLKMEKNELYWDKDKIKLNAIQCAYITSDTTALLNLFKDGEIAIAELDSETLKSALNERYKIRKFLNGRLRYLAFNHRQDRIPRNLNFRKAVQAAFDPQILVDKVIAIPGTEPGYSIIPFWLKGVADNFRKEYPEKRAAIDVGQAKEYLEKARQELGLETFPPLVLLCDDTPTITKQAEYLQGVFKETLGLEIKIDKQIFKQRLAKANAGDFDLMIGGWLPDYDDPMTYADLFASWNENNSGKYANSEYDKLIDIANNSVDQKVRMDAMGKCQDIIFNDVGVLPLYEGAINYVQNNNIKGIVRSVTGVDPTYTYSNVVKPKE
jgi:oligopeptide transport system substrate-binding protein